MDVVGAGLGDDWFHLHRAGPDRALLVGFDVEDGETKFGGAADEVETDLLAGAPGWWAEIVRTRHPGAFLDGAESDPITLVCGWDGKNWTKAIGAPDATLVAQWLELDKDA